MQREGNEIEGFQVVKHDHLTPDLIEKYVDILTQAFCSNQLFYSYLTGKNPKVLRKFIKILVGYNNHFADFYALVRDDEKWSAVAIYLPVGCEAISLRTAIKRKKLGLLVQFFLAQPVKYTKRVLRFSNLEGQYWLKEPFVNLDAVGALEKGAGKMLIEATLGNYNGQNIALNSSVDKNDHVYYTQFGFETYQTFEMDGYKTAMMVRRA